MRGGEGDNKRRYGQEQWRRGKDERLRGMERVRVECMNGRRNRGLCCDHPFKSVPKNKASE